MNVLAAIYLLAAVASCVSAENYTNSPLIWQDLADSDVLRVNDTYYYSASTMHFSPGAPILRSYDLVNWEYLSHSVPHLTDFSPSSQYNLQNGTRYNQGIYASYLGYRKSNGLWYWGGCITGDYKTYIYTAPSVTGPWTKKGVISRCYYDAGLLIDDDDTMYVTHLIGWNDRRFAIARLTSDGLAEAEHRFVWDMPNNEYYEGTRPYKRNGAYYIFTVRPFGSQFILKSTSGTVWGPWDIRQVVSGQNSPLAGDDAPMQGALINTPSGAWHYTGFSFCYPSGRLPFLAPVTWDSNGWPSVNWVNNAWGASYPYPLPRRDVKSLTGTDTFTTLGPQYEWNHNANDNYWSLVQGGGLQLRTATVTDSFWLAQNTLTHRTIGPVSTMTIDLDYSKMADGDRAGLVLFRHKAGYLAVVRSGTTYQLQFYNGLDLNSSSSWAPGNKGSVSATANISGGRVWLALTVDSNLGQNKTGAFKYSTDGLTFTTLGQHLQDNASNSFFMGYRYGVFNFATKALGGSVIVRALNLALGATPVVPVASSSSTTPSSTSTSSSSSSSTTTTTTTTTSSSGGCTAAHWAQCGGQGFAGCTTCESGTTCTYQNDYYSQCL